MNTTRAKLGVLGGIVGGMAMGMWMMLYYFASDRGFWSPLGYIGHFFLRDSDITSTGQVIVGLIVHMMVSMMLGATLASILPPTTLVAAVLRGMAAGLVVWVVMEYVVLNVADEVAYEGLVDWAFAVGHALFGAMVGFIVAAAPSSQADRFGRVAEPA